MNLQDDNQFIKFFNTNEDNVILLKTDAKASAEVKHFRQVMAVVCHLNKNTKIMPHIVCKCEQAINHCSKSYLNGNRSNRNPFCSILGPTLCANCSVRLNRQHALKDTARIFEGFPDADCSTREKALWNRLQSIDEIDLDDNGSDEETYGEERIFSSSLIPGSIARNNSPCIEYIRTVNANNVPKHDFFYSKSLKETLRHISHIMNSNRRTVNNSERTIPKRGLIPDKKTSSATSASVTSEETRLPAIISKRTATPYTNPITRPRVNRYSWPADIAATNLDTEHLSQKISALIEKRTRPPVNRTTSVESSIYGLELPPIESICEETEYDVMDRGNNTNTATQPVELPAI